MELWPGLPRASWAAVAFISWSPLLHDRSSLPAYLLNRAATLARNGIEVVKGDLDDESTLRSGLEGYRREPAKSSRDVAQSS